MKFGLLIAALPCLLAGCGGTFAPPPGGYSPPPLETNPFAIRRGMPSISGNGQIPISQAPAAPTYTAFWTGKSSFGQSVTGSSITICEYNYAGRTFTRGYQTSCPATIQIQ